MRYVRRKYACDIGALQVLAGAIEALVTGYALPLRAVSPLEGGVNMYRRLCFFMADAVYLLMQSSLLFLILGLLFYTNDVKCRGNKWGRRHGGEGKATR